MYTRIITIFLTMALAWCVYGQEADFDAELARTGYIHEILPLDRANSLEAVAAAKLVLAERAVNVGTWDFDGIGSMRTDSTAIVMTFPTWLPARPKGGADDADYALYGHAVARYRMSGENFEEFNRIAFRVKPDCPGQRVTSMCFYMQNSRHTPVKEGYNVATGDHLLNLENGRWNECYLEIADLQRDHVSELRFSVSINGKDLTTPDTASFAIKDIRFQKILKPDKVSGWEPDEDAIVYSMTGYSTDGRKTAVAGSSLSGKFSLVDNVTGKTVFTGKVRRRTTSIGTFNEIDFTSFSQPGQYYLLCSGHRTRPFAIGDESIWDNSQWRVINYIFGQRCGYHVPGVHGKCHVDLFAVHDGEKISFSGGWHDAGDMSQQSLQTADVAYSLLEASEKAACRNPVLSARLREEALWGLDFVLRCRFGDGYRASSMGLLHWQDGKIDSYDDIHSVRVQNAPFDNYLLSAYEAYAARVLPEAAMRDYLRRVALEDFAFAEKQFKIVGNGGYINPYEHTYSTSMSQFMATVSWAASQLYALTGEQRFADKAAEAIDYVLCCQQTDPIDGHKCLCGFFYRDMTRRSLVHSIHQSREQIYMQALDALCSTQPESATASRCLYAARLYGDYLKSIISYTAPYGMLPSGVYRDDEYLDAEGFNSLHIFAPDNAVDLFKEQIAQGERLSDHFFMKRFPIWFNIFNGNLAIHFSMGKSAAIVGRMLGDSVLTDIAREQLYWTVGKNPFCQSLIYGEGHRYPQMDSFSSGELTGEMPVGIRNLGNSDEPYWPQINNACYKEVWVTSAGKWLSLLAEL